MKCNVFKKAPSGFLTRSYNNHTNINWNISNNILQEKKYQNKRNEKKRTNDEGNDVLNYIEIEKK